MKAMCTRSEVLVIHLIPPDKSEALNFPEGGIIERLVKHCFKYPGSPLANGIHNDERRQLLIFEGMFQYRHTARNKKTIPTRDGRRMPKTDKNLM